MDTGFFITTSRKPSVLTRRLQKWLLVLLGGISQNRGKQSISQLAQSAKLKGYRYLIIIHESHSNPSQLAFFDNELSLSVVNISISNSPDLNASEQRIPSSLNHLILCNGEMETQFCKMFQNVYDSSIQESKYTISIIAQNKTLRFELNGKSIGPQIKLNSYAEFSNVEEEE